MPSAPARRMLLRLAALALAVGVHGLSLGQASAGTATALPPTVEAALRRAQLPREALAIVVADATASAAPRLAWRAEAPMNPASVMKLVTTYGALELLGPAYSWSTPVIVDGPIRDGTLQGNLVIRGSGDPTLVVERLWLLMRRIQGLGIARIAGDIVLDRTLFSGPETDPASFDGEPLRPYNAAPDALLLNFKSIVLSFVPDPAAGIARVQMDPPLAGVDAQPGVPLAPGAECGDWRASLRADFSDPTRVRFAGSYPGTCPERAWPIAYADPRSYAARAVAGMWQAVGGRLDGVVREGRAPARAARTPGAVPTIVIEARSPALAEVIRDINKYSNNVMAQQVFLTLGTQAPVGGAPGSSTQDAARAALMRWWQERFGGSADAPLIDNGSGLSRDNRISAQALARLLQAAHASAVMPEFMASLPVAGVDGTMRRSRSRATGAAHLKTGSLRDVSAIAGYVLGASGRRYAVAALINHPNAGAAARPVFDALLDWVVQEP